VRVWTLGATEGLEDKAGDTLGFVVLTGKVGFELLFEAGNEIEDFPGRRHGDLLFLSPRAVESFAYFRFGGLHPPATAKPTPGRIAVKVINHLGDEVMKVFPING
jgi:hypothetical protein